MSTRHKRLNRRALSAACALASLALASSTFAAAHGNAGDAPVLTAKTFRNPPRSVRPAYRWWLPLAAKGDVHIFIAAGRGLAPGDTVQLGSGDQTQTVAITQVDADSVAGCATPLGAPADASHLTLSAPLKSELAIAVPLTSDAGLKVIKVLAVQCANEPCAGPKRLLAAATAKDLTALRDALGNLSWTAPQGGMPWWIIAFYQTADGQSVGGITDNSPAYVIDYIGPSGMAALKAYYDAHILTPRLKSLMRRNGNALFEDSYEPSNSLKWTDAFIEEFEKRRGYSLTPYLPALAGSGMGAQRGYFDFKDLGERVREDYRQTWSDLYRDNHLKPFTAWANQLGMKSRVQIEGGPMEIGDLAQYADLPEGENRNFLNNPELWKVVALGAHMRLSESVVSTECCPVDGGVWATTTGGPAYTVAQGTGAPFGKSGNNSNLNWIYKAYMGGVNQLIWHGYPYLTTLAGTGDRSLWPGNSFDGNPQFSEAFGPRMPQWRDYKQVNDHLARLQLVLRQGRPRYDIAVFWHDFGVKGLAPNVTPYTGYPGLSHMFTTTSRLAEAGFTYQYLSPGYLDTATETDVRDGLLWPDRLGFKAIVLNSQTVMPAESLRVIYRLAEMAHMPVIFVGATPVRTAGYGQEANDHEIERLIAAFHELAAQPNTHVAFVADEKVIDITLDAFGVRPAAAHVSQPADSALLSVRRQSPDADYYVLFNQSTTRVHQIVALEGEGEISKLDLWNGTDERLALFNAANGQTVLPIDLGANDIQVIAIRRSDKAQTAPHALETDAADVRVQGGRLVVRAVANGHYRTRRADGSTVHTEVTGLNGPFPFATWTLDPVSWTPDATRLPGLNHTLRTALPQRAVIADADGTLPGWTALGMPDVAGTGTYRASFDLSGSQCCKAYLSLGRVVDTVRLTVNGKAVPGLNLQDLTRIDIGGFLKAGRNDIVVEVATPLRNAVIAATGAAAPRMTNYGLIGPVTVTPYADTPLPPSSR